MNHNSKRLSSMVLAVLVVLSVFAGSFAGVAAASHGDDSDADLTDGKTYWEGQVLLHSSANADTTYEVRGTDESNSDYFQQIVAESDGTLLIDTSEMPSGNYEVATEQGADAHTFEVYKQSFDVTATDNDASDTQHTFEVDSNRAGFDVVVEADSLDATELSEVFTDGAVEHQNTDDERFVISDINDGAALDASFSEDYAGEYNITFTVADTGASSTVENFTASAPDDAVAAFDDSLYNENEGDVASFNVTLNNTDSAYVTFGDDADVNYKYQFEVTDGNDDGVVTVEFDTRKAGNGAQDHVSAADSKDSVTHHTDDWNVPGEHLDAYTYPLSVGIGDDAENYEEHDVASLIIEERSTGDASTYVVPKGEQTSDVDEIVNATSAADSVAMGDKLVVQFNASGLYSEMDSYTADDLNGENGISVEVEQTGNIFNSEAKKLDVSEATLRTDAENDRFFLVFDTSDHSALEVGENYEVRFNLTEDYAYIDSEEEEESATVNFGVDEREATLDAYDRGDDVVSITPDEQFVMDGETTVAPNTEFTVIARNTGTDFPFLYSEDVVVNEDGEFSAEFNFSGLEAGDEFELELRGFQKHTAQIADGAETEYDLTLDAEDENGESIDAEFTVDGEAVENGSIALTDGTYNVEATADGYLDASQQVTIDGESRAATLTMEPAPDEYALTVNVENADGESVDADVTVDGDEYVEGMMLEDGNTYTVEASADGYETSSQDVSIDGDDETVTLTLSEDSTPTDTETETPDDPAQPGFGVVVGLVALLGAALLARRRD